MLALGKLGKVVGLGGGLATPPPADECVPEVELMVPCEMGSSSSSGVGSNVAFALDGSQVRKRLLPDGRALSRRLLQVRKRPFGSTFSPPFFAGGASEWKE